MSEDLFRGTDADLVNSIKSLIELNQAGALTPRVPTMAIQLLTSAATRLASQQEAK